MLHLELNKSIQYTHTRVYMKKYIFPTDLVKQCNIERKAKSVGQVDLLRQGAAELLGRHGRVRQHRLGGAVHEGDGKHDGLL